MALTDQLTAIAEAIRRKTGEAGTMTLAEMPRRIADIETGSGGGDGELPQLHAPSIAITEDTLRITNPAENGDFVTDYAVYVDGKRSVTTRETTLTLSGNIASSSHTVTVRATAPHFADSPDSNAAYWWHYYAVSYYDGSTLLYEERVRAGGDGTYLAAKEGYQFDGWQPSNKKIYADTVCYAQWSETITFANATWKQINEICTSGQAADYFKPGDTRTETIKHPEYNISSEMECVVLAIGGETLASGESAGITIGWRYAGGSNLSYSELGSGTAMTMAVNWDKGPNPPRTYPCEPYMKATGLPGSRNWFFPSVQGVSGGYPPFGSTDASRKAFIKASQNSIFILRDKKSADSRYYVLSSTGGISTNYSPNSMNYNVIGMPCGCI